MPSEILENIFLYCVISLAIKFSSLINDVSGPRDANFCKDHRNKTEVLDPLAVEDLISYKNQLNDRRKLARLIAQYRKVYSYAA